MKEIIKKEIGEIPVNGRQYYMADGTWSLFELIDYILDYIPPSDVTLTSFSLSEDSIRHLDHLKETGKILSLKGLFDPSLRKTKTPLLFFALEVFDLIRLVANHSKIVLFNNPKTPVVLIASANLGRNKRMETGVIETDKTVFGFYLKHIDNALHEAQDV